ncbi:phage tail sheath family protein [Leptolyngbya sp. AN02str]|uniref:phage tail sheath family protein n=1 Tax=Leptolyngbya sp. AN02str TaxID=3423363 RepID=UPI003D320A55
MPPYSSPGVYVEEIASGSSPIVGVGTSTAGFIGVLNLSKTPATESPQPSEKILLKQGGSAVVSSGSAANDRKSFTFDIEEPLGKVSKGYNFFSRPVADADSPTAAFTDLKGGNVTLSENSENSATVTFAEGVSKNHQLFATYTPPAEADKPVPSNNASGLEQVKLCTNFTEFTVAFANAMKPGNYLADAIYGFFRNGGTRCYVVCVADEGKIGAVLENQFEAIDEIALVAAPGVTSTAPLQAIADHCAKMGDRFAILDGLQTVELSSVKLTEALKPFDSKFAALYFPWIEVYDPDTKKGKLVPPSGHIAGIYARVDAQRGVHKAPANEPVLGATGVAHSLSKAKQGPLNEAGINCIRELNGNILVWGARTLGGDDNGEFKYISTRRLFNYLTESIDEGTQWTVFEPNSPELWAAIRRNVSAFLTQVWRSGALFGATPEQAFYVKCDAETNPSDQRNQGQVVTVIGVAVVKPAEFVIFRLSQRSEGQQ